MEKIKLVIWDLDETFWEGTLSEGGINIKDKNVAIVKSLVDRGIMNSISSKNDFQKAKEQLQEMDIWDYFVFPHISWEPKGQQIESIVKKMQLRNVNTLFIDDNHSNIEEAKFYNQGIETATPNFLNNLLSHPAFKGKKDHNHSRLKQYRILEAKQKEKQHYSSNKEFLNSSDITLSFIDDLSENKKRLNELIQRTNQLNFTKKRIDSNELEKLLQNEKIEKRLIRVKDRFGDYGIIGFYALDKDTHSLLHFLFSCRTLNLGIEQYVYSKLNFPDINIIGEVVSNLNNEETPDWIKEEKDSKRNNKRPSKHNKKIKVFFKGGCDLSQMLFYVKDSFDIREEVNYVMENNFPIHYEHTDIVLQTYKNILPKDKSLPFLDQGIFKTKIFDGHYDVLIYSVLMDYTQEVYVHHSGYKIPYGGYSDITLEENKVKTLKIWKDRGFHEYDESFLERFKAEYKNIGPISTQRFLKNLSQIRNFIPSDIPILFINGSEQNINNPREKGAAERHKEMNKALDHFIAHHPNCYLLDVRKLATSTKLHTDNIRHYKRIVYVEMAEETKRLLYAIFKKKSILRDSSFLSKMINKNELLFKLFVKYPKEIKRRFK